jgi:hypothetical protein
MGISYRRRCIKKQQRRRGKPMGKGKMKNEKWDQGQQSPTAPQGKAK